MGEGADGARARAERLRRGRIRQCRRRWRRFSVRAAARVVLRRAPRHLDLEQRACALLALDADGAAHLLQRAARDPQTQAEATVLVLWRGALIALEDHALLVHGDADAAID